MKSILNLSLSGLFALVFFASCDKEDIVVSKTDTSTQEEGVMSVSGEQEEKIEDAGNLINSEVVFQKHYDGSLSEEEANEMWQNDLKNRVLPAELKDTDVYQWYTSVNTRTGPESSHGSDGYAECSIFFWTNWWLKSTTNVKLDDPNKDDREGDDGSPWDYYLIRSYTDKYLPDWIEIKNAELRLKGTDGWYVTGFTMHIYSYNQVYSCTGDAHLMSYPYEWLDSSTSSGWDSYSTESDNVEGYGRVTFN